MLRAGRVHGFWAIAILTCLCIAGAALPAAAAAEGAWKIGVRKTGLYRLTGADLAKAGIPIDTIERRTLRLRSRGREVALSVPGSVDGRLAPEDTIAFYGVALDTPYTDTNVYWLSWGGEPGKRWGTRVSRTGGGRTRQTYYEVTHLEQNHLYGKLPYVEDPGEIPHWFWGMAQPETPAEATFSLDGLSPDGPAPRIAVSLWGNTTLPSIDPDHHTQVLLNGHVLDDARWDGERERRIEREVPRNWLVEGANKLSLRCPGDTAAGTLDYVYLDWIEVSYERRLAAREGALTFTAPPGHRAFDISGMGTAALALDVTHPESPVTVGPVEAREEVARFTDTSRAAATYLVTSTDRALQPAWIARAALPGLHTKDQAADYIVVAGDGLASPLGPLVEWRRKQGLRVAVVNVGDIYDEFSDGIFTPVAIRDFLAWAREHWRPPAPRFVLLIGDGNYDYRDYMGTGKANRVPPCLVRVRNAMEAAFDGAYATSGPDRAPALAIGRIPARTADEVRLAVEKVLAYEQAPAAPWQKQVVMVADHDRSDDQAGWYEQACGSVVRSFTGSELEFRTIALRRQEMLALKDVGERIRWVRQNVTPGLLKAINEGALVVEYQGHGDAQRWSRLRLLEEEDIAKLHHKGRWPVFLEISCFTGWFDNPRLADGCLAARLLFHPDGGAVACVSASRLGGSNFDALLWAEWRRAGHKTLGEALLAAWRQGWSNDGGFWPALASYNLLGDPALRMPLPQTPASPAPRLARPSDEQIARARAMTTPPLALPVQAIEIRLETGLVRALPVPRLSGGALPPPEGGWQRGYYLIQFAPGQAGAGRQAVERARGEVVEALVGDAAVAYLPAAAAQALAADKDVRWLGGFLPYYKVAPALAAQTLTDEGPVRVQIRCFREGERRAVAARLPSLGGECLEMAGNTHADTLQARLPAAMVYQAAQWPEVRAMLLPDTDAR